MPGKLCYEETFRGDQEVRPPAFPNLALRVSRLFA